MDPRLEVNKTLITGYLDLVKPKVREEVLADVVKDGKVDKEALACLIDKAAASIGVIADNPQLDKYLGKIDGYKEVEDAGPELFNFVKELTT